MARVQPNKKSISTPHNLGSYRDFKVYYFLCECTHIIRETEGIFARLLCGEHEIALSFLGSIQNDFLLRILDFIINIKRTTCLNLTKLITALQKLRIQQNKTRFSRLLYRPMHKNMLFRSRQFYMSRQWLSRCLAMTEGVLILL